MTTTVLVNGMDLEAEWPALSVSRLPDYLVRSAVAATDFVLPGLPGTLGTTPVQVDPRIVTVGVAVGEETVTAARALLDQVQRWIGAGPVTLQTADRPDRMIVARLTQAMWEATAPGELVSTDLRAVLVFRASYPYWRHVSAEPIWVDDAYRPIPMWSAPSSAVFDVLPNGATVTTPTIHLARADGTPVRSSTLSITLGINDAVRVVTAPGAQAIYKSLAGVVTRDDSLLASGNLLPPGLQPGWGNAHLGLYPLAKVTAVSGTPRMRVRHLRQEL